MNTNEFIRKWTEQLRIPLYQEVFESMERDLMSVIHNCSVSDQPDPKPTEWISVKDRLPEHDIPNLLVWFNNDFHEAFYRSGQLRMDGESGSYDVTDIVCYWKLIESPVTPPKKG